MKTLIITADEEFLKQISFCLKLRYPEAVIIDSQNVNYSMSIIKNERLDLVAVDCALSDTTTDLVKRIRDNSDAALMVFCETNNEIRTAELIESGADEYSPKEFKSIRLIATINSLIRRVKGTGTKSRLIVAGGLQIDLSSRQVSQDGKPVHLTPTEFSLLEVLVQNRNVVVTNEMLLERVWGLDYDSGDDFVKKYVHRLRNKLGDNGKRPQMIVNERGIGYRFYNL